LIIQFKSTQAFWVLKEDVPAKVAVRRTMDVPFLLPSLLACLTGRLPGPLLCVQLAEVEGAKLATCIVCVLASSMMIG
jgi:ABC-type sulfate transport system permease component